METGKIETPESEIPEIIEFCKLDTKIFSESLVFDRFFTYVDTKNANVLKLMDIDFQKIVFESKSEESPIEKICCFDSYCVYTTENKKLSLREITSPNKATLASVLKQQQTITVEDEISELSNYVEGIQLMAYKRHTHTVFLELYVKNRRICKR